MSSFHLETSRLKIRPPEPSDIHYFMKWLSDSETAAHVGGVRPQDRTQETFESVCAGWQKTSFGRGMLVLKSTQEIIGVCGISEMELAGKIENDLGYLIDKKYWGCGFATEASQAMMNYAIDQLGMKRITAWPSAQNAPSVRVVEKLGFKFEKNFTQEQWGVVREGMCLYVWVAGS